MRRPRLRGAVAATTAAVAVMGVATSAHAATTTYPAGGSTFASDAQGWTPSAEDCSGVGGVLTLLCNTDAEFDASGGNPDGAIVTDVNVTLNVLGLFEGAATWTSPAFTVPAGANVTGAELRLDRAHDVGGLLTLSPSGEVVATLVDETAGSETELTSEPVGADSVYATMNVAAPAGAVVAGHTYRLRLDTTITSTVASAGVLGTTTMSYDNVGLTVATADTGGPGGPGTPGGPGGPGGRGGATVKPPLSDSEIARLISSLSINVDVGSGPGGSQVPLSQCTIMGTPGADRIAGTAGNDVICGIGMNDMISGGGGRDVIDGADGADRLRGGAGGDLLLGLRSNDRLDGGAGSDGLGAGAGKDSLAGGGGNDRLSGRIGNDRLGGGAGNDRLAAASGNDRLNGGSGRDRLAGQSGRDLFGARDRTSDVVLGGPGSDRALVDRASGGSKRTRGLRPNDRVRGVERIR
jgi:Ca2+-binding RTX toxin-like protein